MVNEKELLENVDDLDKLSEDKELIDLECLIKKGVDAEVPITFDFPGTDTKVKAIIKPISATNWTMAANKSLKHNESMELEVCKKCLCNSDGKLIKASLIEKIPAGVLIDLFNQIREISGIKEDKELQSQLTKKIMGF